MDLSILATQLAQAGWTMFPLLACSVAALGLTLHKAVEFFGHRVGDAGVLQSAEPWLATGELAALVEHCDAVHSPTARVMGATARAALEAPARAESVGHRALDAEVARYQSWLPALGWIAQVAPLFGLLGTVIGMVELFGVLEAAGSTADTAMVTGGIWKALLTTAAGLVVAIPTLGVHLWLSRVVQRLDRAGEEAVGRVLDALERRA